MRWYELQIVHRIALLALIPIFEKLLYPLFSHWNFLTSQLSRIFWGGIAAAVAFGLSGVVEIYSKVKYLINFRTYVIQTKCIC